MKKQSLLLLEMVVMATMLFTLFSCQKDRFSNDGISDELVPYEHTKVIDSNIFKLISTQDELQQGLYKYENASEYAQDFEVSDIVIGSTGEGYLRKVIKIETQGDVLIFSTEQATLDEAFEKIDLDLGKYFTDAEMGKTSGMSINLPTMNVFKYDHNNWIKLKNGKFSFNPNFTYQIQKDGWSINYVDIGLDNAQMSLDYDLQFNVGTSLSNFNNTKTLWFFEAPVKTIMIGKIPLVISAQFILTSKYYGSLASVNSTTHLNYQRDFTVGARYDHGSFDPYFESSSQNSMYGFSISDFDFQDLQTSLNARYTLNVKPKLYGTVGIDLSAQINGNMKVNYSLDTHDKDASLKAYTKFGAGLNMGFFFVKGITFSQYFNGPTYDLYKYPHALEVSTTQLQNCTSGQTKQINFDIFDYIDMPSPYIQVHLEPEHGSVNQSIVTSNTDGQASVNWTLSSDPVQKLKAVVRNANGSVVDEKMIIATLEGYDADAEIIDQNNNNQSQNNNSSAIPLEVFQGTIYNMDGPQAGAWNMIDHQQVYITGDDELKDMVNFTEIGTATQDFVIGFKALNQTQFSKITQVQFEQDAFNAVEQVYDQQNFTQQIDQVQEGEFYMARLRQEDKYALIEIKEVHLTNTDDLDYISFDYKIVVEQ